ncbi:MAG: hypothetical protein R3E89_02280 [Thiolinea sp.]
MTMLEQQLLGTLQGKVLIFGGNYGNLQATQALQAVAAARGISALTHHLQR